MHAHEGVCVCDCMYDHEGVSMCENICECVYMCAYVRVFKCMCV